VVLGRAQDTACVFLSSDDLCELHAELGAERKPLVCQTYPYLFTETPDGVFTSLSYACPAALQGLGPELEASRESLESMVRSRWEELPQAASVGARVEVSRGRWMPWSDYLRLENEILRAFSAPRAVESLLGMAVHLLWLEPQGEEYAWPLEGHDLAAAYNFGGFDVELATMVSCNLLAITEDVTDAEERARLGNFLWNGGRQASARLGLELPPFALMQPRGPEAAELIGRYVSNAIFGKRLLAGTIVSRLLALACGLAIVLFYADALTRAEGKADFSLAAMDRAFTIVESELLSHTRSFDGFFTELEEALRSVRDGLRAGPGVS
jgi:hypothetical protein